MTAMSADGLVSRLFQIVDGRSWDELGTLFTEDARYERPGYEPLKGIDRIRHFYIHERIIAAGSVHLVDHITSSLGAAACWGRLRGAALNGEPLNEEFADTYVIRDGRIAHRKTFFYRPAI
ncbi:nuclear transport factor 2 family protein [Streptomyces sp. MI02-7b]|uniref:nuclear transport factor 2 family protein n=1 Tax=Streptomyces sp. MI02-7b TaxID=462941 RepID=UPI0029BDEA1F|nr:nuclear transport factor 2 family protein [Streptomyces sp. MI02-7b]MDX3078418.1 nuclear transport factor 2 family protein [Streptomyces sp. MI02-7b]